MRRYTLQELEAMPTLAVGQADDLKVEEWTDEGKIRVWLSRCGVEDGEPWPNNVTIERYHGDYYGFRGSWQIIDQYQAEES